MDLYINYCRFFGIFPSVSFIKFDFEFFFANKCEKTVLVYSSSGLVTMPFKYSSSTATGIKSYKFFYPGRPLLFSPFDLEYLRSFNDFAQNFLDKLNDTGLNESIQKLLSVLFIFSHQ